MPLVDNRTLTLRTRCMERKTLIGVWDSDPRLVARSLRSTAEVTPWATRRGMLTRDLLSWTTFALDDLELLVGRLAPDQPEWVEERAAARLYLQEHAPNVFTPGQSGHCQLDLSRLLMLGIDGLHAELSQAMEDSGPQQHIVLHSFLLALEGLQEMVKNAARTADQASAYANESRRDELAEMAAGPQGSRRDELAEIAAACWNIAHHPPATFLEALQLSYLAILGCQVADRAGLVSPGHLDRFLWPYYQADLAAGRITPQQGLLLVEALYLLLNENIPDGLAIAIMVGGKDASGNDLTNPLSYLCLEALRRTRLVYPTVGICWHPGTPEELSALAIDLIAQGCPNPAFFGDETIQRGLRMYGVPPEESWDYVNSTCVEITPVGASNVWVASPYFSTCGILLDEITAQVDSGQPAGTYEAFLDGYRARLAQEIAAAVAAENESRRARQQYGGKPLQSLFTRDCVARGLDIDSGGARYNWVECSFVGLANLADSLHVLREEVFHLKRMSLDQLHRVLQADFSGYERERQRFLNGHPKYGNGCAEVDGLVGEIVTFARAECARHQMEPDGSPFIPGAFCWVMHERLGRQCGATPDGRRAGFPFADGCGPAQGRDQSGPTTAVRSVTTWDAAPLIGGAAFNMKFSTSLFSTPETLQRLRDLVVTFLQRGGFETQVNVVDARTLRAAQENPEAYRDLVVRIGGYTDYFTRLTPEMQSEVIMRTEYAGV